jgi:hypothetical protein
MSMSLRDAIIDELRAAGEVQVGATLSVEASRALLDRHLPALLEALDARLVTDLEVAGVVTDRFAAELAFDAGLPLAATLGAPWDEAVEQVRRLLAGRSG